MGYAERTVAGSCRAIETLPPPAVVRFSGCHLWWGYLGGFTGLLGRQVGMFVPRVQL
jgi:hypothetical protein